MGNLELEEQGKKYLAERKRQGMKDKIADVAVPVGGVAFLGGVLVGSIAFANRMEQYNHDHQPAPMEQPAPASHSGNQTEFSGSNGQKVNLQSHEQARETLAQLHK